MTADGVLQWIAFLVTLTICRGQLFCNPSTLTDRIFRGYSPVVRPDPNGDPIIVDHQYELLRINSLDFDTGLLSFDAWDDVYWRDTRLTWNFCSNPEVRVTRDKVWLPQVFIYFGANQPNDKVSGSLISITKEGYTGYTADRTIEVYCDVPSPFNNGDECDCNITVGSWNYDFNDMGFNVLTGGGMSLAYFSDTNKDVEVVNTSSAIVNLEFDCCPDPFVTIVYTLTLKRTSPAK